LRSSGGIASGKRWRPVGQPPQRPQHHGEQHGNADRLVELIELEFRHLARCVCVMVSPMAISARMPAAISQCRAIAAAS